jgi:hypothetical protein
LKEAEMKKSLKAQLDEMRLERVALLRENGRLRNHLDFLDDLIGGLQAELSERKFKAGPPAGLPPARRRGK